MIFTKINFVICIFQRLCKPFMPYYLLEATLHVFFCFFFLFTINLFSLINGETILLYHNRHQEKDSVFKPS